MQGDPVAQGSLQRAFRGSHALYHANAKRLLPWRDAIASEAARYLRLYGAIHLELEFRVRRPKGHYDSRGNLRPAAPLRPVTRPDLDKYVRAVLDALTEVLYDDDSQVAQIVASKVYAISEQHTGLTVRAYAF